MVSLGSSHQGRLPNLGWMIDVGFIFFNQQFAYFKATVDCCSMKRSSFVVDSQGIVDDSRLVFKYPLNIWYIFALDIPEKIFVPSVAVCYAFDWSHCSII